METALKEQLWSYIASHNPDLMYELQEEYRVSDYLQEKVSSIIHEAEDLLEKGLPPYTIQEICMERLTTDLKPSRYLYIKNILEEEFPTAYEPMQQSGMLTYEVLNIIQYCQHLFDRFGFQAESVENKRLRYAVIGEIDHYIS